MATPHMAEERKEVSIMSRKESPKKKVSQLKSMHTPAKLRAMSKSMSCRGK